MKDFMVLCEYYEPTRMHPYRAHCNKLKREVKLKECNETCGWYRMIQEDNQRSDIGIGTLVEEDVRRLLGE